MTTPSAPASDLHRLTDAERERLLTELHRDGYCVLPGLLPSSWIQSCIAAIDRIAAQHRRGRGAPGDTPVKVMNCVDEDPAFRRLMLYEPALQLSYDAFGPMFHLCQSNLVSRPDDGTTASDFLSSTPWHADGPRPGLFPSVGGAMGLHYLKFGYFFTDLRHGDGGALQVVRGSHRRAELDGMPHASFSIADHAQDVVTFHCAPGTVVAFHQAQWHAAPPNRSPIERKNAYISYCPTWMRPFDREPLRPGEGSDLGAEERWLLGEHRPASRWWLPDGTDTERMARFRRDEMSQAVPTLRYD